MKVEGEGGQGKGKDMDIVVWVTCASGKWGSGRALHKSHHLNCKLKDRYDLTW